MSLRGSNPPRRPLGPFLLVALAIGALLIAASWVPGVTEGYLGLLRAQAGLAYAPFDGDLEARLEPPGPDADAWADTLLVGIHRPTGARAFEVSVPMWRRGFLPTAVLAALVLATPIAWRRRVLALVAGLVLLDAFVLAQLGIMAWAIVGQITAASPEDRVWWERASLVAAGSFSSRTPIVAATLLVWTAVARPGRALDLRAAGRRLGRALSGRRPVDGGRA